MAEAVDEPCDGANEEGVGMWVCWNQGDYCTVPTEQKASEFHCCELLPDKVICLLSNVSTCRP